MQPDKRASMDTDSPFRRFHLTRRPLAKVFAGPSPQPAGRKPGGLWWASGTVWLDQVRHGGPGSGITKRFREADRAYEVTLKPEPGLLTIRTADDLMDVTMHYGAPLPHVDPERMSAMWERDGDRWRYRPERDTFLASHNRCQVNTLDWQAVSRDYRGVEMLIQPGGIHTDPDRTRFEWADIDWAVPSGCAWDTRALAKVALVPWGEFSALQGGGPAPEDPVPAFRP